MLINAAICGFKGLTGVLLLCKHLQTELTEITAEPQKRNDFLSENSFMERLCLSAELQTIILNKIIRSVLTCMQISSIISFFKSFREKNPKIEATDTPNSLHKCLFMVLSGSVIFPLLSFVISYAGRTKETILVPIHSACRLANIFLFKVRK